MARKTIQKRHADKWIKNIDSMERFSLDNSFKAEKINAPMTIARMYLDRGNAKFYVRTDEDGNETLRGGIDVHSNLWFEITFSQVPAKAARKPRKNLQK